MQKNILNELNRARKIMGLNLLSEEELKNNVTLKEDIYEMDMEVREQEVEGEEEEVVDPNAVVTKVKDVLFGQDGINIGAELVYKYNKQKQTPVKGSAVVRWSDYGDLISKNDERKPVQNWTYEYNKDSKMRDMLANNYPERYKIGISTMLKKMVERKAEELGLDVGDVNQLFASFSEFDPSRYLPRTVQMKDAGKRSKGEKGTYMGYQLNRKKRPNEQDAPEKFSNFVLSYTPKDGKEKQTVYFYKNGGNAGSESRWREMVQGVIDRNEKYEFCQALPDELKNAKKWSQTSSNVRGKYDSRNSIKC